MIDCEYNLLPRCSSWVLLLLLRCALLLQLLGAAAHTGTFRAVAPSLYTCPYIAPALVYILPTPTLFSHCTLYSAGLLASTYLEVQEVQQLKEAYDATLVGSEGYT